MRMREQLFDGLGLLVLLVAVVGVVARSLRVLLLDHDGVVALPELLDVLRGQLGVLLLDEFVEAFYNRR